MGIINGNAIYQRVMEWELKEFNVADGYVDDVIVGSTGATWEESLANHERDLESVLDKFAQDRMVVNGEKVHMFVDNVGFCGHVLTQGKSSPGPKKLLSIQKWQVPITVIALGGFLWLTNYYSSYVENYAKLAAPLTAKLQLTREEGKKGSQKVLVWDAAEVRAFEDLKAALGRGLSLH